MKTTIYPQENDRQVDARVSQEIEAAKKRSSERVCVIRSQNPTPPKSQNTAQSITAGMGCLLTVVSVLTICFLGMVGGAMIAFMPFFVLIILLVFISVTVMDRITKKSYKKRMREYSNEQNAIKNRITQEEQALYAEIAEIQRKGENEKKKYHEEFEKKAQELSVQFANSQLVKEIVDWMMEGLSQQIDSADRSSHIKEVSAPFEFTVCRDAVLCSRGIYDFQQRRCQPLNQPLEQVGLAKALAADLQLAILMKYPKDSSGTKVKIRMEQTYRIEEQNASVYAGVYNTDNCPQTTVSYQADNGNYKDLRKW